MSCLFIVDSTITGKLGGIAWLVIIVLVILFSMKVETFFDISSNSNSRTDDLQFTVLATMCLFSLFVCANFLTSSEARVFLLRFNHL